MTEAAETEILPAERAGAIERALAFLQQGEPVAFPTDTVYGLGARMDQAEAIDRLYAVKERSSTKAIPVLVGDPSQLSQVSGELHGMARVFAERFWPGPLTLIVPRRMDLPENLSIQPTVGVRMPDHPVALALLRRSGPLAATSANRSGGEDTRDAGEVYAQLNGLIPLILDGGRTPGGQASTVVDCTGEEPVILRPGPLTLEALLAVLREE